jgi:hypothetical protein
MRRLLVSIHTKQKILFRLNVSWYVTNGEKNQYCKFKGLLKKTYKF